MNTIINYKKLNRLTHAKRLPDGTMKYTFIPEKEYQLPKMNPPVPIIHVEGSKHKYIKHMHWWIIHSIRMRQYLTLPGRGHISFKDYPSDPDNDHGIVESHEKNFHLLIK